MDFSKIEFNERDNQGIFLHLDNPANKGEKLFDGKTPVGVTMRSVNSDAFRDESMSMVDEKSRGGQSTARQQYDRHTKMIARMAVSWSGMSFSGDSTFSTKLLEELLNKQSAIRSQCETFIINAENFTETDAND